MEKYMTCPHCDGYGAEPENEKKLCKPCGGDGVILMPHRLDEETANGSCDMCGRSGLVSVEHNVYTDGKGDEKWEYKRSICKICADQ